MTNSIFTKVYSRELKELKVDEHILVMYDSVKSLRKGTYKDLDEGRALIGDKLKNVLVIMKKNDFCFARVKLNGFFTKAKKNAYSDTKYGIFFMLTKLFVLLTVTRVLKC
jgi:hypothetical protein